MKTKRKNEMGLVTGTVTYDERIAPAKREARQSNIDGFISAVKASQESLHLCVENGKSAVNKMREAGYKWIAASDKNQYDLYFYNLSETLVSPEDAKYLTRDVVKTAIHFATVIKEPVKSAAEAAPFIQKCLFAFGLDLQGRREIENEHPPRNIFSELVSEAKSAGALLMEWQKERPLNSRTAQELDTFIKEWKPVFDAYVLAQHLRTRID